MRTLLATLALLIAGTAHGQITYRMVYRTGNAMPFDLTPTQPIYIDTDDDDDEEDNTEEIGQLLLLLQQGLSDRFEGIEDLIDEEHESTREILAAKIEVLEARLEAQQGGGCTSAYAVPSNPFMCGQPIRNLIRLGSLRRGWLPPGSMIIQR